MTREFVHLTRARSAGTQRGRHAAARRHAPEIGYWIGRRMFGPAIP